MGAPARVNKGTCTNKSTIAAVEVEKRVLNGLRECLMEPELVETFIEEYHAELRRLQ
jgi:hypothetical protein